MGTLERGAALAALFTLVVACRARTQSTDSEFTRPITSYNTLTVRTAYASQFLQNSTELRGAVNTSRLALGPQAEVNLFSALPNEVVLVFNASSLSAADWGSNTSRVPFLQPFVYTSEAPAAPLAAWGNLSSGNSTAGALADATEGLMAGEQVLRVICIGQGPAGGLAILCGPWAALQYPLANVDVITFNTSWDGFNTQFAWSFEQLVVLHYLWPFAAPVLANASGGVLAAAEAVNPLITNENIPGAVQLPNLPAFAPEEWQKPDDQYFADAYTALGPNTSLPEEYQLAPSDCPVMICKTRPLLRASCLGWKNDTVLGGLPNVVLHDNKTNADAIVGWNESSKTAYFLFKYTEEKRDWLADANGIQVSGFPASVEDLLPHSVPAEKHNDSLTSLIDDVQVHAGFLNQFESLAISPATDAQNLTYQLYKLNGGGMPRRVACSGFSLGGALSELCGVWAAILWPGADVLVTNQGGPIPGNSGFKLLFEAASGRAYKYVYRMDLVPSVAPFSWYKRVPASIWINGTTALLQDRPKFDLLEFGKGEGLSWNDHTCDTYTDPDTNETIIGYVPRLYNIARVSVPKWVYTAVPEQQ